jgi:succinate-acetate transporter protein
MRTNLGKTDRIIRLAIAVTIGAIYFGGKLEGTLGIVLLAVAAVFALTAFISFCPLYFALCINSLAKDGSDPTSD